MENYELVWRTLRRLGVPQPSVEDAAQQVLVVLARRLSEVRVGAERALMPSGSVKRAAGSRPRSSRRVPEATNASRSGTLPGSRALRTGLITCCNMADCPPQSGGCSGMGQCKTP